GRDHRTCRYRWICTGHRPTSFVLLEPRRFCDGSQYHQLLAPNGNQSTACRNCINLSCEVYVSPLSDGSVVHCLYIRISNRTFTSCIGATSHHAPGMGDFCIDGYRYCARHHIENADRSENLSDALDWHHRGYRHRETIPSVLFQAPCQK